MRPGVARARHALETLLPSHRLTLLLRAALLPEHAARPAWDAWCREVGDPLSALRRARGEVGGLLPLLLEASRAEDAVAGAGAPLRTYLKAAAVRERLRVGTYRRVCAEALSALERRGVAAVVTGGAALAETVYAKPWHRHCHDVDLLVDAHQVKDALSALARSGFRPSRGRLAPGARRALVHDSGLPLWLRVRPLPPAYHDLPGAEVIARSVPHVVAGVAARVPSTSDQLLVVCGPALGSSRPRSAQWACDAWSVLERGAAIDWELLARSAVQARLALPLSVTLGYVHHRLEAPVPERVLAELGAAASRTDARGVARALSAAHARPRVAVARLVHRRRRARELTAPGGARA